MDNDNLNKGENMRVFLDKDHLLIKPETPFEDSWLREHGKTEKGGFSGGFYFIINSTSGSGNVWTIFPDRESFLESIQPENA